jgi:carboxysome shell carbonic anhydrase
MRAGAINPRGKLPTGYRWREQPVRHALLGNALMARPAAGGAQALAAPAIHAAPHPLADGVLSAALRVRSEEIEAAFSAIEPTLRNLAVGQFAPDFAAQAQATLRRQLGVEVPVALLESTWVRPLDMPRLHARCVIGTFCRLAARDVGRGHPQLGAGESAEELIRRWGFHAIDITPCADGRLSGVVDHILRVPPAVIAYRKSYAGALFDVEETLRHWETVELRRWRESSPNPAGDPTRFLKIGVYHYSSVDPDHEGCAAHGSDAGRAAGALLERLEQFRLAVQNTHCCAASVATLLVGVDTDTDAIRVHVPDATGQMSVSRYVDNRELYATTHGLDREAAKQAIRDAVAACCGVTADEAGTEGSRWFCGYLLKNNLEQVDAVRAWHGSGYADRGHTERLIVVGDAIDDVQLRNLAFQAQMETAEEGATDLDVGVRILRRLHEPRSLAVPVLVHLRYDPRIPGARERATLRAHRLRAAIESRYRSFVDAGALHVQAVVRDGPGSLLLDADTPPDAAAGAHTEMH